MYGTRYSCTNLMKLGISRQIFEKRSNIKVREIISSGNRVVPYGQTDRDEDANGCFLLFCGRFSKNAQISNFVKLYPVGTELFHTDRRTGMKMLTVAFRYFANAHNTAVK